MVADFDEVRVHCVLPEIFGTISREDRVVIFSSITLTLFGSAYCLFRDEAMFLLFFGGIGVLGVWFFQTKLAMEQNIDDVAAEFNKWFLYAHRNYRYNKFKNALISRNVSLDDVENYFELIDTWANLLGKKYNYGLIFTALFSFLLGISVNIIYGLMKLNLYSVLLIFLLFFASAIFYLVFRLFVPSWSERYGELSMFLYRYKLDIKAGVAV